MRLLTRMGMAVAASAAIVASLLPATAANAETVSPPFFNQNNWWNTVNPTAAEFSPFDGTDKWLYPNFPIACNNSTLNNHLRAYWVYPDDTANTMPAEYVRKVLTAGTSGITASAKQTLGSTVASLKSKAALRWHTTERADGSCTPSVTPVAVPRGYLTRTHGTGMWYPYFNGGTAGELEDYLDDLGLMPDNRLSVFLLQEWGSPSNLKGVTTSSSDPTPGPTNYNNYGGKSAYINMEDMEPGTNEWGDEAWTVLHEVTHTLGAFVNGSPNENTQNGSGHAADCWDALCYPSKATNGQTYLPACQGDVVPDWTSSYGDIKSISRLDCNNDDYWSPVNTAPWSWTRWNTYNSSFLWHNNGQPAPRPAARGTSPYAPEVIAD